MLDPLAVLNAVMAGVLLGGFYAAVALGIAIAFGMLDIPNLSHPAFVVVGAFAAWLLNSQLGLDPVLAGLIMAPPFFVLGALLYRPTMSASSAAATPPCRAWRSSSACCSSPRWRWC
jgi:branched-chain amino acid transport system permease protein